MKIVSLLGYVYPRSVGLDSGFGGVSNFPTVVKEFG